MNKFITVSITSFTRFKKKTLTTHNSLFPILRVPCTTRHVLNLFISTLVDKILTYLSAGEEDNDSSEDSIPTNIDTFVMWSCGNPVEILEFMTTKFFYKFWGLKYPQIYALHKL